MSVSTDAGTSPDAGLDAGTSALRDAGFFADDSGCPPTWSSGTEATTYQVDSAHTGEQPDDRLPLPLCQRWSHDLGGNTGYAVVSDGLVYVISIGAQGRQLWALDQYTGATRWGPTVLGDTYFWAALAVGGGSVFALSDNGNLVAFDAHTGQQRWIQQVGSTESSPTVSESSVFVSVHLQVKSLDVTTGATRWARSVANGDMSSPAVSGDLVSASFACNQAYGFSFAGTQCWHATNSCSGGGGKTTTIHGGRVFTRDFMGNLILDGATGTLMGNYTSQFIPAFAADTAIFSSASNTQGVALSNNQVKWNASGVLAAPVVMGAHVVLPTTTGLIVLDAQSGVEVGRTTLTVIHGTDEQNVSSPFAGLNAANGMLFVPVGTTVIAYQVARMRGMTNRRGRAHRAEPHPL
jgi:outer membrane protein assembly factor BamB